MIFSLNSVIVIVLQVKYYTCMMFSLNFRDHLAKQIKTGETKERIRRRNEEDDYAQMVKMADEWNIRVAEAR